MTVPPAEDLFKVCAEHVAFGEIVVPGASAMLGVPVFGLCCEGTNVFAESCTMVLVIQQSTRSHSNKWYFENQWLRVTIQDQRPFLFFLFFYQFFFLGNQWCLFQRKCAGNLSKPSPDFATFVYYIQQTRQV